MKTTTKRVRRWESLTIAQQSRVTFADVFAYIGRDKEESLAWAKAEQRRDARRDRRSSPASCSRVIRGSAGNGGGNGYWTGT